MSEFKGTRGEWIFDNANMKIKGSGDIEGMTVIANVSPKMDYSKGMTTQFYNANLIACAPKLLEILNKILIHIDWSYENWTSNDGLIIKDEIEELIKKATL